VASISMRSGVSIKSVDTNGIVNTIREPKILTTARTANADKDLQKTPPCVLPTPRFFPTSLQKRPALAHVYARTHILTQTSLPIVKLHDGVSSCYVLASVVFLLTTESVSADEATVKFNDVNSGLTGIHRHRRREITECGKSEIESANSSVELNFRIY